MVRERRGERGRIAGHPRRTRSDRGAVIVEAAFAVPILVALLCLPVALLVGLLAAVVPTYRASRLEVADQLRRE